jgi:uncharacterized membrane protein (DUF485 family)
MQEDLVKKIQQHPKYMELVSKRSTFAWVLTVIMLVIYYAFILLIAFNPAWLGKPVSEGMITSIGIPIGMLIIISAFILTGIYVQRANTEFDELTKQIKEDVK